MIRSVYAPLITPGNIRLFLKGHRRTAVFALSPQCNCRCSMCGMWRIQPERISYEDAKRVIDFLVENRFLVIYFTGGEPTLYRKLTDLVKYANRSGLVTTLTTNGTASSEILEELKNSGLQSISISLDHFRPEVCDSIRNFKNIMKMQIKAIRYAGTLGLRPYALAYLNLQILEDGVEGLVKYVNEELDVPWGFCFPTEAWNSYSLCREKHSVKQLRMAMQSILDLKLHSRDAIANTFSYISDAIRFLEGKRTMNKCRSGQDVVYIDWHGDVYPCFLKGKMFNVLNDKPNFQLVNCDQCLTNCFREPSYLAHITLPFIVRELSH